MNSNSKREKNDYYPTPPCVIKNFLENYKIDPKAKILEPCAGAGNIVKELQEIGAVDITAVEIDETKKEELLKILPTDKVIITDFLKFEGGQHNYDVIITNPPFSLAMEFVKKALDIVNENGIVIMLLRTAFLESQRRYDFWQQPENKLTGLYTLSHRPSFIGKGTDATSYSWFIWDKSSNKQTIKVIKGR